MGTLRWGILGTGWIAHAQTADLLANGFTVTAVGSRTMDAAAAFAGEFGIRNAHATYEELVADDEVDAVYVSTPHPLHAANALLALEAGRHVLVEKPFALNAREARQVIDLAESRGLVALEAMWTRYLPTMVRLRTLIADGVIGDVRTLIADHDQVLSDDPLARGLNPDLGGGALLDLGIYPVSFAYDLFGTPTTVLANAAMTATGVDRQTAIVLGFDGGRQAVMHAALDTRGPNRAVVLGTKGRIELDAVWYTATSFTMFDSAGEEI
ncbi:MAG TPA: Gfo/Idh/MocA family oxidoreductase, partial [Terrimesophilobacter sp.]|nr:Gfo/Idh/MocA family oxidoreductase [Terrimesophilobacter sp.]